MSYRLLEATSHVDFSSTNPSVVLLVAPPTVEPEPEQVSQVKVVVYLIYVNLTSKELSPGQLWCDTGSARGLGGNRQHQALNNVYRPYMLRPVTERCNGARQCCNGQMEQAMLTKVFLFCERYRPRLHKPSGCQAKLRVVS